MAYKLGRFLQLVGLLILPIAIAGNVNESLNLREMLTWATVGIGVFGLGWLLQQTGKP